MTARVNIARAQSTGPAHGLSAALIGMAFILSASAAVAGSVEIAVTGVAAARGHVRVELCTRTTFLTKTCPYQGVATATVGSTVVKIAEVPPGEYAVQAFQDETDQGVVHQNLLGIPKERIGFSNDAPLHAKGPRFADAAFTVGKHMQHVTLRLRKLFGFLG